MDRAGMGGAQSHGWEQQSLPQLLIARPPRTPGSSWRSSRSLVVRSVVTATSFSRKVSSAAGVAPTC